MNRNNNIANTQDNGNSSPWVEYTRKVDGEEIEFALLLCPFCGGRPRMREKMGRRAPFFFVACDGCNAQSCPQSTEWVCEQKAIRESVKRWNRRANDE